MKNIILNCKEFYLKQLNNNKKLTVAITVLLFIFLIIIIPKPLSERRKNIKKSVYETCITTLNENKCRCFSKAYIKRISNESVAYRLHIERKVSSNNDMKQILHDTFLAELDCINVK